MSDTKNHTAPPAPATSTETGPAQAAPTGTAPAPAPAPVPVRGTPATTAEPSTGKSPSEFYGLSAKTAKGENFSFEQLRGKVVLIVNTASKCGFTPQYKGLQELYDKYKDRGFTILGFPCNQFGSQEPGSEDEIVSFCELNHGVSFPLMAKVNVNGDDTHPVYNYLKSEKSGILGLTRIKWNFEKFLVGSDGKVVERYSSVTTPEKIAKDIEPLLPSPSI
ncbi:MAG: glutathione peroxidase [Piptocephalis tieghemiana]|nr:MAG: glutathione peroxidase [Piptocephalis tieghemiana]